MEKARDELLKSGREAVSRHAWSDGFDLLVAADESSSLSAEDLELLGDAAFWTGRLRDCIRYRERSHAGYAQSRDPLREAHMAIAVALGHFWQRNSVVGSGWLNKAERILEDAEEAPEHGQLANWKAHILIGNGDLDRAFEAAQKCFDIGRRCADRDLQAHGLSAQGSILVRQGEVQKGMALIDESMASAVGGELGPEATAAIYCTTISACHRIGDYRRAAEWTQEADACAVRPGQADFPGDCRAHRVGILRMHGTWTEAEREAEQAAQVEGCEHSHVGMAIYELGEIRLRKGDLAAAEDAFRRADDMGKTPQPGLALLRLFQGKIDAAKSLIEGVLEDEPWDRLARARLLPTLVEIAVAAGDLPGARIAVDELHRISETYQTTALTAASKCAHGALLLAAGNAVEAASELRRGWHLWRDVEAPYEVARSRLALAEALRELGDPEGSSTEARAAHAIFDRLGALPDVQKTDRLIEQIEVAKVSERRLVRTFMFTDIVSSTSLVEAMGDDAWAAVLRWHDQALRSQFRSHHGEEIDHAGDGFFVAFVDPDSAITCAIEIQRALAEHRVAHGFSPQVRIGLHASAASTQGTGYQGKGVHRAARIGALAEGGDVLVSKETLDAATTQFETKEPRTVVLKGLSEPATVIDIAWR